MKKTLKIVKLYFYEPLALMSEKKDEFQNEVLVFPSDTLKGALISGLAWSGSPEEEITHFNEALKVSSAYPFVNDKYFFPKPMAKLPFVETGEPGENKVFKKIQFIEKNLFEKILNAEPIKLKSDNFIHSGKFIVENKQGYPEKIYESQTEERVSIGNTNIFAEAEKGSPFYVSRTYFIQQEAKKDKKEFRAGLYFIYESDSETEKLLKKSLEILQDEGLGADRRMGNGHFFYEITGMDLELPESADRQLILSKYIPTQTEIAGGILEKASYNLSKRGGYLAGTTREAFAHYSKRDIYTIDEASLFDASREIKGKYVDLLDENNRKDIGHPVWREGRPVVLAYKSIENDQNHG